MSNHNYFSYFYINVANAVILVFLGFPYDPFQRNADLGDLGGAILRICGYRKTSFLDIGKKFRQYGKMKDTFRGSNLAKESVSDLFIGLRDILMLYLDMFWP